MLLLNLLNVIFFNALISIDEISVTSYCVGGADGFCGRGRNLTTLAHKNKTTCKVGCHQV